MRPKVTFAGENIFNRNFAWLIKAINLGKVSEKKTMELGQYLQKLYSPDLRDWTNI